MESLHQVFSGYGYDEQLESGELDFEVEGGDAFSDWSDSFEDLLKEQAKCCVCKAVVNWDYQAPVRIGYSNETMTMQRGSTLDIFPGHYDEAMEEMPKDLLEYIASNYVLDMPLEDKDGLLPGDNAEQQDPYEERIPKQETQTKTFML